MEFPNENPKHFLRFFVNTYIYLSSTLNLIYVFWFFSSNKTKSFHERFYHKIHVNMYNGYFLTLRGVEVDMDEFPESSLLIFGFFGIL